MGTGDGQEVGQQLIPEEKRQEPQVEQLGMRRPVVVLLQLHPGVVEVHDLGTPDRVRDHLCQFTDREGLGELVEHAEFPGAGRVADRQLDACQRVTNVEKAPRLAPFAINGQRLAGRRLNDEPVQHRAEHGVVVEPGGQVRMQRGLRRWTGRTPPPD